MRDRPGIQGHIEHGAISSAARGRASRKMLVHFMWCDEIVRLALGQAGVTRPLEGAGRRDHSRAHRIELDIPVAGKQVALAFDGARLESTLPESPGAAVQVVEVRDVAAAEHL